MYGGGGEGGDRCISLSGIQRTFIMLLFRVMLCVTVISIVMLKGCWFMLVCIKIYNVFMLVYIKIYNLFMLVCIKIYDLFMLVCIKIYNLFMLVCIKIYNLFM